MAQSPCFLLPLPIPSLHPFLLPFTYLEILLGVIGSRPPWSQVTRELTSTFFLNPSPSPPIPNSRHPFSDFPSIPRQQRRWLEMTRLRLTGSGTICLFSLNILHRVPLVFRFDCNQLCTWKPCNNIITRLSCIITRLLCTTVLHGFHVPLHGFHVLWHVCTVYVSAISTNAMWGPTVLKSWFIPANFLLGTKEKYYG
jgi:hypothetical protein